MRDAFAGVRARVGVATLVIAIGGMAGGQSVFARSPSVLPPGGGFYGGGKIAPRFSATDQSRDAQVLLHVANNRHTVRVGAFLWSKCSGPGVSPAGNGDVGSNPATGVLHHDGKFSGEVSYTTQGTAGKFQNTFKFSGHFASGERAVGTADIEGVNIANHSIRCGTGRVAFEVDDPTLSRGSGGFSRGAAYFGANDAGPTAEGLGNPPFGPQPVWPMLLRTASHGRSVALVSYFFSTMKCQNSTHSVSEPEFGPPPANVKQDGSFTEVDQFNSALGGGFSGRFTDTVKGRFGGHRVHGSVRVDVAIASSTGAVVDHCTTGERKWAAVRAGSG